jgi:deoxyribonuclease V
MSRRAARTERPEARRPKRRAARVASPITQHDAVVPEQWWPSDDRELVALQYEVARAADRVLEADPWTLAPHPLIGGCFVAFATTGRGGRAGDPGWAAAVAWQPSEEQGPRWIERHLRGPNPGGAPRRADDVLAQAVAGGRASAAYAPGLLAARDGPLLAAALAALGVVPDVLLVDACGADHPRRAGLAVHLGAALDLPTVGVTRRPLVAAGAEPARRRGARAPLYADGRCVAYWVCTRDDIAPVVAHAGWRTDPMTAAATVLAASTPGARAPVPLQEARRVAREARARSSGSATPAARDEAP